MKNLLFLLLTSIVLISCGVDTNTTYEETVTKPPSSYGAALATSYTPLDMLTSSTYSGRTGGLYNGTNTIPAAHLTDLAANCKAVKRDANPVLLALGASNTAMEFDVFMEQYSFLPNKNPKLKLVNGCRGAQSLDKMGVDDYLSTFVPGILSANGITANDVDVIWLKTSLLGNAAQTMTFSAYTAMNVAEYTRVLKLINSQFPNCKVLMFSGRHNTWQISGTGSYAQHAEPVAYWDSWAIKDIINKQITKADFSYTAYPTYIWAFPFYTGKNSANSFGHFWNTTTDSRPNNPHPTDAGKDNTAAYMINYMSTDVNLKKFFVVN